MKTLIIAEKPSQAKDYKQMLEEKLNQSFESKSGYFESKDYYLSWVFGHLITLADPAVYNWAEWTTENLPMIPEQWEYIIKSDGGVKKQFSTIKSLLNKSSKVINGADPDREGELIVRLVLLKANKLDIPQFRLWAQSLTVNDLYKSFQNIKSAKEYNNLYAAANCRQRADWLIGMNLSRAYSIKANRSSSIGRVQTPTLAMIYNRDKEIHFWKDAFYKQITASWNNYNFNYKGTDKDKLQNIEFIEEAEQIQADRLAIELQGQTATTTSLETKKSSKQPPLLYNLADLQKIANQKLKLSADQTLKTVQSLYERKLLSYPRTDCKYLAEDMYQDAKKTLDGLIDVESKKHLNPSTPKAFNDKMITAHTAIIPVGNNTAGLSDTELNVFNLVKERFILSFLAPSKEELTKIVINANGHYFEYNHTHILELGFKAVLNQDDTTPFNNTINDTSENKLNNVECVQKERTKPKHYTEATLLTAMESCAKKILDKDLKSSLQDVKGIGTPATRSSIIETLIKRGYVESDKNYLYSTQKGVDLIKNIHPKIASPEMTAEWEMMLSDIEHGKLKWREFYDKIVAFTITTTQEVLDSDNIDVFKEEVIKCPKCSEESVKLNSHGAFCSDDDCGFKLWSKQFGKVLSSEQLSTLITKGITKTIAFKSSKTKKSYSAKLKLNLNKDSLTELEFVQSKNIKYGKNK